MEVIDWVRHRIYFLELPIYYENAITREGQRSEMRKLYYTKVLSNIAGKVKSAEPVLLFINFPFCPILFLFFA